MTQRGQARHGEGLAPGAVPFGEQVAASQRGRAVTGRRAGDGSGGAAHLAGFAPGAVLLRDHERPALAGRPVKVAGGAVAGRGARQQRSAAEIDLLAGDWGSDAQRLAPHAAPIGDREEPVPARPNMVDPDRGAVRSRSAGQRGEGPPARRVRRPRQLARPAPAAAGRDRAGSRCRHQHAGGQRSGDANRPAPRASRPHSRRLPAPRERAGESQANAPARSRLDDQTAPWP